MLLVMTQSALAFTLLGLDFSEEPEPIQPPWVIDVASFPADFAAPGELEEALSFVVDTYNAESGAILHLNDGGEASGAANELVIHYVPSTADSAVGLAVASWSSETGASCSIEIYGANSGGPLDWYPAVDGAAIGPNQSDLIGTMLHEMGHCLGLGHSEVPNAVMAPSSLVGTTERALTADDIAGVQAIYGVATTGLSAEGFLFVDDDGDGVLGRDETGVVTVTVENTGNVRTSDVIMGVEGAVFEGVTADDVVLDVLAPADPTELMLAVVADDTCSAKDGMLDVAVTASNGERIVVGSVPVECKGGLGCSSSAAPVSLVAFVLAGLLGRRRR